jgi:hypothetical protein
MSGIQRTLGLRVLGPSLVNKVGWLFGDVFALVFLLTC